MDQISVIEVEQQYHQYGIAHKLDIYTDAGHAFPPSFDHQIATALEFVTNAVR